MARGWESKSVESQQAEAGEKADPTRRKLSPEEAAAVREKASLELARQRVRGQIDQSTNPRHKKLLQDALADLDEKLRRF
jgi:hypothetical protein